MYFFLRLSLFWVIWIAHSEDARAYCVPLQAIATHSYNCMGFSVLWHSLMPQTVNWPSIAKRVFSISEVKVIVSTLFTAAVKSWSEKLVKCSATASVKTKFLFFFIETRKMRMMKTLPNVWATLLGSVLMLLYSLKKLLV